MTAQKEEGVCGHTGRQETSLPPDSKSWETALQTERPVHLPACPERVLWPYPLGLVKAALWDNLEQGDPKMRLNAIFTMGLGVWVSHASEWLQG